MASIRCLSNGANAAGRAGRTSVHQRLVATSPVFSPHTHRHRRREAWRGIEKIKMVRLME